MHLPFLTNCSLLWCLWNKNRKTEHWTGRFLYILGGNVHLMDWNSLGAWNCPVIQIGISESSWIQISFFSKVKFVLVWILFPNRRLKATLFCQKIAACKNICKSFVPIPLSTDRKVAKYLRSRYYRASLSIIQILLQTQFVFSKLWQESLQMQNSKNGIC